MWTPKQESYLVHPGISQPRRDNPLQCQQVPRSQSICMQEIKKNTVAPIIFKAMSMDEITKGWGPEHSKPEVSKVIGI